MASAGHTKKGQKRILENLKYLNRILSSKEEKITGNWCERNTVNFCVELNVIGDIGES